MFDSIAQSRRTPTFHERMTPCEICSYPITQRHHLLSFAQWGGDEYTVSLCPNCHEFYHLIERAEQGHARSSVMIWRIREFDGADNIRYYKLLGLYTYAQQVISEAKYYQRNRSEFILLKAKHHDRVKELWNDEKERQLHIQLRASGRRKAYRYYRPYW